MEGTEILFEKGPVISIIVAVYNNAETLQRCIDSVSEQSYPLKELIIMDGGSTDGTVEILEKNNHKITYWESKSDKGIANAWNKALAQINGEWVLFLGSDDYLFDNFVLEKISKVLTKHNNNADVVFGNVMLIKQNGYEIKQIGQPWRWSSFRYKMSIPHQGAFHARRLFDEVGYFNETLKIVSDYELLLRKGHNLIAIYVNSLVSKMQIGGISQRGAKSVLKEWKISQIMHKTSLKFLIQINYQWSVFKLFIKGLLN